MQTAIATPAAPAVSAILEGLHLLFRDGDVVELRAFRTNPKFGKTTISGFYNDLNLLAEDLSVINAKNTTAFVTLNPIAASWQTVNNMAYEGGSPLLSEIKDAGLDPAFSSRLKAKKNLNTGNIFYSPRTTSDFDIASRQHVLIDIDAGQPTDTNSTDVEKATAYDMMLAVRDYLLSLGFPEPAFCDSGNGYHLLPQIDLPNDDASTALVQRFLLALAQKFDGKFGKAHIDIGVFNAARITKAYGSVAYKGDPTAERPHRQSKVLSAGAGVVSRELLEKVAVEYTGTLQDKAPEGDVISDEQVLKEVELIKRFLTWGEIDFDDPYTSGSSVFIPVACPNKDQHSNTGAPSETIVTILATGARGFNCFHAHCSDINWKKFRAIVETQHKKAHPDSKPFPWGGTVFSSGKKKIKPADDSEGHTAPSTVSR
jgi:hypothetical protein